LAAGSIVGQLGLRTTLQGPITRGVAGVIDELCIPGTSTLRTSVLATWVDIVSGAVAGTAIDPRIPLTLDLEVQLHRPIPSGVEVGLEAEAVKVGRSIVLSEVRIADAASGEPFGLALVSFVASPNPEHVFEGGFPTLAHLDRRLDMPLADRVGGTVVGPGTFDLPRRPDGLNASGAIQGGLVVFGAEEAVRAACKAPLVATSLTIRYLRPFTIGPARCIADVRDDFAMVRLTDRGTGKLGAVVTMRLGCT
jgi:acyl-coenzyme A thioesterase PaaI-like protein